LGTTKESLNAYINKDDPGVLPLIIEKMMLIKQNTASNLRLKTSIFEIYLDKKIDLIDESDSKSFDGLNIIELDDIQTSIKDIFKCLKKKNW
jgi:hypothetical protein